MSSWRGGYCGSALCCQNYWKCGINQWQALHEVCSKWYSSGLQWTNLEILLRRFLLAWQRDAHKSFLEVVLHTQQICSKLFMVNYIIFWNMHSYHESKGSSSSNPVSYKNEKKGIQFKFLLAFFFFFFPRIQNGRNTVRVFTWISRKKKSRFVYVLVGST